MKVKKVKSQSQIYDEKVDFGKVNNFLNVYNRFYKW